MEWLWLLPYLHYSDCYPLFHCNIQSVSAVVLSSLLKVIVISSRTHPSRFFLVPRAKSLSDVSVISRYLNYPSLVHHWCGMVLNSQQKPNISAIIFFQCSYCNFSIIIIIAFLTKGRRSLWISIEFIIVCEFPWVAKDIGVISR